MSKSATTDITDVNELIAAFKKYFKLVHADSPQLLHQVFRLRYQVYCEDAHLYERSLFPEREENDEYDRRSIHILLQHRPSERYVGTVRLVLSDPSDLDKPFPTEALARFDPKFAGVPRRLRSHVAEISRFAILHRFPHHEAGRARRYRGQATAAGGQSKLRLRFPHPTCALAVGIMRSSVEHEITHWYASTGPSVDRLLNHLSLHLQVVGPVFEFWGQRRPHFDSITNVLNKAYRQHPEVWELITDRGRLWPAPSKPEITPLTQ